MRLIDADKITNVEIGDYLGVEHCTCVLEMREMLDAQPTVHFPDAVRNELAWISCEDIMPEEYDSPYKKYYGTGGWEKGMYQKKSKNVLVTMVYRDGFTNTEVSYTCDGEWRRHRMGSMGVGKVVAWMPFPKPYVEEN